ncbi:hypothetical protein ACQ5SU_003058 [Listeria monocytogenes]|nr:hypothetical protein [Listeria monocytogenes]
MTCWATSLVSFAGICGLTPADSDAVIKILAIIDWIISLLNVA